MKLFNGYKYKPNANCDDSYVVSEFARIMPVLEDVHRCKVRLVKTAGLLGFRYAIYELIENKEQNNDR